MGVVLREGIWYNGQRKIGGWGGMLGLSEQTKDILDGFRALEPNMTLSIGISVEGKRAHLVFDRSRRKEDLTHLYDIGSITKVFTATYLAKLIVDGKCSLSDRLCRFLPIGEGSPTLAQLATHTAYHPVFSKGFIRNAFFKKKALSYNVYQGQRREDLIRYANRHKVKDDRGYFYADIHFAMLGEVISEIEQKPYYAVMEAYIRNELGLTHTGFSFAPRENISYHRKKSGAFYWTKDNPYLAAGGLHTNITDALSFLEGCVACENDAQKLVQKKQRSILLRRFHMGIGMGWHIHLHPNRYYHKGGVSGYRTYFLFDPKKKIALAVLANAPGDMQYNVAKLATYLYKDIRTQKGSYV